MAHLGLFFLLDWNIDPREPPTPPLQFKLQISSFDADPQDSAEPESVESLSSPEGSEQQTPIEEVPIETPVISEAVAVTETPRPAAASNEFDAIDSQTNDSTAESAQPILLADMIKAVARLADGSATPRVRRLFEGTDKTAEERYYMEAWLRKIQRIGQLNYPQKAIDQKLYGELTIYVAISPDGSLQETRILETSGHEVLDEAAVRIVELAAPFAPFTASMQATTDMLEIVKIWEFRKRG